LIIIIIKDENDGCSNYDSAYGDLRTLWPYMDCQSSQSESLPKMQTVSKQTEVKEGGTVKKAKKGSSPDA
jgi:hypothetical protein